MRLFLFRAVRPAELASIQQLGRFENISGIECKYFATDVNGARRFAALAENRFGDGPYSIVVTAMDVSLLPSGCRVVVDGGIEIVTIATNLLYALRPPEILEE